MADTATITDGGDEPSLTSDEWRVLEKYHRGGYNADWNVRDKDALTSALRKCYGEVRPLPPTFREKVRKWIKDGAGTDK